jgi:excisionase family DNA binding protein
VARGSAAATSETLYSILEAADLWSVSRSTIERLMRRRDLRYVKVGAHRRIPASALEEYTAEHADSYR